MQEAEEQIEINAAKSRTCTMLLLSVSLSLIYNGKAIHSQLPAYLMVTLNHSMKTMAKVLPLGKKMCTEIKVFFLNLQHFCSRWQLRGLKEEERASSFSSKNRLKISYVEKPSFFSAVI